MHVFKLCWKLMIHAWKATLLYLVMFIGLVILVKSNLFSSKEEKFTKIPIYLINEDDGSLLADEFLQYIDDFVLPVEKDMESDNEYKMKEQLMYEGFQCIIYIPENFTDTFMLDGEMQIERYQLFETKETVFLELIINEFVTILEEHYDESLPLSMIIENVNRKFSLKINETVYEQPQTNNQQFAMYINYLSYMIFSIIMSFTGNVVINLRKDKISKRNEIAPIRKNMIYKEAALALYLMSLLLTIGMVFCGIYFTKVNLEEVTVGLICVNMLLYSTFCTSTALVVAVSIHTPKRLELIEQIIVVGTSFLGGVFVAQKVMSEEILNISKLIPSYWFVKVNNDLAEMEMVTFHDYQQIAIQDGIILLYTMVLLVIALIIAEKKVKLD